MHALWGALTILSPDRKHFANGSNGHSLQTFAINDDYSITPIISEEVFPIINEGGSYKSVAFGLLSFAADNDNVYSSFAETENEADANKIGVWSWEGTPERLIITDAPIVSIGVTEDGKTMYGFIVVDGEAALAKMDLD